MFNEINVVKQEDPPLLAVYNQILTAVLKHLL